MLAIVGRTANRLASESDPARVEAVLANEIRAALRADATATSERGRNAASARLMSVFSSVALSYCKVARPWYPYAERFFALTTDAVPQVKTALHRQPVVAVALMTLMYQPERAEQFWQGLAMDDGLSRNDPRKALLEKLRSQEGAHSVPAQLHAVAAGWNAFYEGRKLKAIQVRMDKPFTIAGTKIVRRRFDAEIADARKDSH